MLLNTSAIVSTYFQFNFFQFNLFSYVHLVDGEDGLKVLLLQGDGRLVRCLGVVVPGEMYPGHGAEDDGCGALGAHLVDPAGDGFLR